ncbi:MAG: hypothetical protein QG650_608, partial [Patescibacteria group bacterium]|nr:hypothetical protein [Patescibacteria group bacterium]
QKGEIRYVHTLLRENVALLDKIDPERTRFSLVKAGNDPHGAMKTGDNRFLLSFQYAKFLLDFDTASDEFSIMENSDLFGDSLEDLKFGATFFRSNEASLGGESRFYLTRAGRSKESLDYVLENYSCTTDLSKKELVSRKRSEHLLRPPHVSKECDGLLFHSNFFHAGYRIPSLGKICPTRTQFLERVYADLEALYRRTPQGKNDSPEKLYDPVSGKELSKNFSNFIDRLKKKVGATDFYELVRKTLYEVDLVPGSFDVLDLRSGKESLYRASAVATGHFEFDERRKRMFVSSHNFDPTMKGVAITYF